MIKRGFVGIILGMMLGGGIGLGIGLPTNRTIGMASCVGAVFGTIAVAFSEEQ